MLAVGVIEIAAGLLVAFRPRIGAYVVALWLWGIIANLLLIPGFYDITLRDSTFWTVMGQMSPGKAATPSIA